MIKTDFPVAFDSPDHLHPHGTRRDNSTSAKFTRQMSRYFKRKIRVLDLGCAGGQMVIDFNNAGHLAIGLEGSDYNERYGRFNWPNGHLFTCDISRPFQMMTKFDLITCWETIEHISCERLVVFVENVLKHLADDGLFLVSAAPFPYRYRGADYHQTVWSIDEWKSYLSNYFDIIDLDFDWLAKVRKNDQIAMKLKK